MDIEHKKVVEKPLKKDMAIQRKVQRTKRFLDVRSNCKSGEKDWANRPK